MIQTEGGTIMLHEENYRTLPSDEKTAKKMGVVDIITTLILSAILFLFSSLMDPIFTRIRADEPVIFSMLGLFLALTIWYAFYENKKHGSLWICTLQGLIILCCAFFPFFKNEPGAEPIIGTIIFALISSCIITVSILLVKKVFNPQVRVLVEGLFCFAIGIMSFVVAWPLPGGIPSGIIKWILQLIAIYVVVFVGFKKMGKIKNLDAQSSGP
jgi:hypothetical protein